MSVEELLDVLDKLGKMYRESSAPEMRGRLDFLIGEVTQAINRRVNDLESIK